MGRIQTECEQAWKDKQKEIAAQQDSENTNTNHGGNKFDFEKGSVSVPLVKKKTENPEEQIQFMVNKRIRMVKQDIILEDDQSMTTKMCSFLRQMRVYDDEFKEILSTKEQKEGYKKMNSQIGTRMGSPITGERNGKLNPLDRKKSPNGLRGNKVV